MQDLNSTYNMLLAVDPSRASKISINDRYRIEKMLHLYLETNVPPSKWFELHPPKPIIENLQIFDIDVDRDILRDRIKQRTLKMIEIGILDEVKMLESKYGRKPNPMQAIGIIEVLEFFDGVHSKDEMIELISIHTAQLAKRQRTFNKNQFKDRVFADVDTLYKNGVEFLSTS